MTLRWRDDGESIGAYASEIRDRVSDVQAQSLFSHGTALLLEHSCHTPAVELEPGTAESYVRHAFTQMLDVVDRIGDELVNERPPGPDTNAVAALVVHSCELTEFWLGHVGLGRASDRDRASEFSRTATVRELHTRVDSTLRQASADLELIVAGKAQADRTGRQFLRDGDESDGALVLHVLEELYQHLGHMEITADVLLARS